MLSCDLHDYIEIACMHHYNIELVMLDGMEYLGCAMNIEVKTNQNKKSEYLIMQLANDKTISIELTEIKSIQTKDAHATFTKIDFH